MSAAPELGGRLWEVVGGKQDPADVIPQDGMTLVLMERYRQIAQFGHTPERDRELPASALFAQAQRYARAVREDLDCHADRDMLLRHAVIATAMWLALVDRLTAEGAEVAP